MSSISTLSKESQEYLTRRWFLWKCSQCDEYLFYRNANIEKNPNPKDKRYDILINGNLYFDVKGTVIPAHMRKDVDSVISNPYEMVKFYYDRQSRGRRYDIQNRLFIVHHSYVDVDREFILRTAWDVKQTCYERFAKIANQIDYIKYSNVFSGLIFILEKDLGKFEYKIYGE